jgi:hypothetical protein
MAQLEDLRKALLSLLLARLVMGMQGSKCLHGLSYEQQ